MHFGKVEFITDIQSSWWTLTKFDKKVFLNYYIITITYERSIKIKCYAFKKMHFGKVEFV